MLIITLKKKKEKWGRYKIWKFKFKLIQSESRDLILMLKGIIWSININVKTFSVKENIFRMQLTSSKK